MDIQSIIVYIILACAVTLIIRHIYRQLTGKSRHCHCNSCPMHPGEDCHCEDCHCEDCAEAHKKSTPNGCS